MPKKTMFGQLLNRVRFERKMARERAERELYKRNKIENPVDRDNYKIEYETRLAKDGSETIYAALWHRVDEEAIKLEMDIKSEVIELTQKDKDDW